MFQRGGVPTSSKVTRPGPVLMKKGEEKEQVIKNEGESWAGSGVELEENSVRRVRRNVFGDIFHQLFGVASG